MVERIGFKPDAELVHEYEITIVQWNQSLGKEFLKFYFINSENDEQYKEVTKLNKKCDEFSKRHEYLLEKLKLEEALWLKQHDNADDVVTDITNNTATMDKPLIPKKAK